MADDCKDRCVPAQPSPVCIPMCEPVCTQPCACFTDGGDVFISSHGLHRVVRLSVYVLWNTQTRVCDEVIYAYVRFIVFTKNLLCVLCTLLDYPAYP